MVHFMFLVACKARRAACLHKYDANTDIALASALHIYKQNHGSLLLDQITQRIRYVTCSINMISSNLINSTSMLLLSLDKARLCYL